ncbi:kielin/chordin-like protein [Branchiostoma floridae x Branchiostoma belcheri]
MLLKVLLPTVVMFASFPVGQSTTPPQPPPVLSEGPGPVCSVDVVFVVDESSSISSSWFGRAKQFIADFFTCFTHLHDIQIGVIPYNCVPRTYLPLSTPTGNFMHYLMQKGGLSKAGVAIRYMTDTSTFRAGVPRAAVVMTDGFSTDNFAAAVAAAVADDIELYAVSLEDPGQVDTAALGAIAGSPDRVFSTDIPCKVAFRILADLCKSSGVPGCLGENDAIAPLGYSYEIPGHGICGKCVCGDNGEMLCTAVGCPLQFPECQNPVDVATWCCPACADDVFNYYNVPEGCLYNGEIIPLGDEYKPDDCTTCTCPAAGAEPVCIAQACRPLDCPCPVHIVGQCCPVCPGCWEGDVLIPVGATYQPNPCTFCSCPYAGATPSCAVMDCAPPPCENYVVPPGECCPVCPTPIGCQHEYGLILPDNSFWPDPCTWCTCQEPGTEPVCYPTPGCPPPPCDDENYVRLPTQCCPMCDTDAPDGCLFDPNDNFLIPVGYDYAIPSDPCMVCTCPFAGGAVACSLIACPPPGCPNPVHIAGVCCPLCTI